MHSRVRLFEYIVIGWNFLGHWYLVETWAKKSKIGISLKFNLYLVETFLVFGWNPICISLKLFWLFVETQLVFRGIFFGISWNFFWYLVETFSGIMKAFSGMKLRWNRTILCPRRENTIGRGWKKCVLWLLSVNFSNPYLYITVRN